MRIALVYDRINKWGGAEQILITLHEIFPDAHLYTSVLDINKAPWAKIFKEIHTSWLQKIPGAKSRHEYLGTFMPITFEQFDFSNYDYVISVTSEAAKGIIVKPPTKHISIILTPTRYLWSGYKIYFKNLLLRIISFPFIKYLKDWDIIASKRPDKLLGISNEVRRRIKTYYKRESDLLYPPVNLEILETKKNNNISKKDYYLIVSRLVAYKKIDLAIKTFNKLGKKLIIVGEGSLKNKLKRSAHNNITFLGFVNEDRLIDLYQEAKALIVPQREDFGIVSVEAQFFNTPVIAYKRGGSSETLVDGKTGILFDKQTVDSLTSAVKEFEKHRFLEKDLFLNANKFSRDLFIKKIKSIIKEND